jgi:hypothetical protein
MAFITFQPSDYFNTKLYTGNDTDGRAITGVGFQPDWVWIKGRNYATDHEVFDAVRGATKYIATNATNAEATNSNRLQSFDSDGFTLGNSTSVNKNYNYVSWNWRAGTGQGSSNTDGSINTTYTSVNTTAGFSISTYTGTGSVSTIGHGLGVAPKVVMIKRRDDTGDWRVFTEMTGNQSQLSLSQTSAADSNNTTMWNSTSPTSTVFTIGTHSNINSNGGTCVAYCFAEKKGFSRFGLYKGNGSSSGTFVFTGFKPGLVIVKRTDSAANWVMTDNAISFNGKGTNESSVLFPSATTVETDAYGLQLYSNGFRFQGSDSASATVNGSGASYIYLAFAAEPFVASNEDPATAN